MLSDADEGPHLCLGDVVYVEVRSAPGGEDLSAPSGKGSLLDWAVLEEDRLHRGIPDAVHLQPGREQGRVASWSRHSY